MATKHLPNLNHAEGVAAAKSLQSCLTLCDPIDGNQQGSPVPGILQARTLEWVAISFSNAGKWKVKVKSLSLVWLLATPRTVAHQAPPSMGFSRQECWSGVPSPSPEGCCWKSQFDQMVVISFHSDFEKRKWLKASFCFSLWSVITNWSLKAIGSCWSFQIAEWDKNNSFITQMLTVKNTPMISSDLLWGPFSGQI